MKPIPTDVYQIQNTDFIVKEEQEKYRTRQISILKLEEIDAYIRDEITDLLIKKSTKKGDWFIKMNRNDLQKLYKLNKPCFFVLFNLVSNVNRSYEPVGWCNLEKYRKQDLLAAARTQTRIAEDLGIDRSQVSKAISKLEQLGLIVEVGKEVELIGGFLTAIPVYSLGVIRRINNKDVEVFYYEVLL